MTDHEPLDLDAILTRANLATGGHLDEAFISADEDVPALIDEVRRLRADLAGAFEKASDYVAELAERIARGQGFDDYQIEKGDHFDLLIPAGDAVMYARGEIHEYEAKWGRVKS